MRLLRRPQRLEASNWPLPAERLRVLLIDDDPDEHVLLRGKLDQIGYTRYDLDAVASYGQGLASIAAEEHDAYLIDYHLAGMDGVNLVREARAAGCAMPLILLTGARDPAIDARAMQAGASDFLEKGNTSPALLERTLRYAVEHARAQAALRRAYEQVSGIEEAGRLLARLGPVDGALDAVVGLLDERFGFRSASLYLLDGDLLRLAAQRGHPHPAPALDPRSGRLAHVLAGTRPMQLPNVTTAPEHRTGQEPMEYCLPLHADGHSVGLMNVGVPEGGIGQSDHESLAVVADRVAVALALNRALRG